MNVTFYKNPDNTLTNPGLPAETGVAAVVTDNVKLALAILAARGIAG